MSFRIIKVLTLNVKVNKNECLWEDKKTLYIPDATHHKRNQHCIPPWGSILPTKNLNSEKISEKSVNFWHTTKGPFLKFLGLVIRPEKWISGQGCHVKSQNFNYFHMGICDINVVGEQERKSVSQNKQTKYNVCILRVTIVIVYNWDN